MSNTTVIPRPTSAEAMRTQAIGALAFAGPASMTALPTCRCQAIELGGPEDVVIDSEAGIAYVSSQKRARFGIRQYEKPGAIYTLRLDDPKPAPSDTSTAAASENFDPANFHPHGIDLVVDESGKAQLFAISHAEGGSRVEVFDVADRSTGRLVHVRTIGPDAVLANPNDIAAVDRNEFYFSNSYSTENRTTVMLQEVLQMRTGSVAHCRFADQGAGTLRIVEEGFSFLSGIAVDRRVEPKRVYVAPLWARKVSVYEQASEGLLIRTDREIRLPGGADNLNLDADGSMWIGAAPDFAAVMAYALGYRDIAPSLVVRIDDLTVDAPEVETVFTDDGHVISAASAAAYYQREGRQRLLVGAPFQDRMLVIDL